MDNGGLFLRDFLKVDISVYYYSTLKPTKYLLHTLKYIYKY
uniref:Uncharacterized protein n=1 Tax=Heterorhabditis bacteriophora TaxID=37862 RepID=A0A1I7WLX1_HETBA